MGFPVREAPAAAVYRPRPGNWRAGEECAFRCGQRKDRSGGLEGHAGGEADPVWGGIKL
jgi:hypothetical protein